MADTTVITVVQEQVAKYKKSIERKPTYLKELEDDRMALTGVTALQDNGDELPDGSPYGSLEEWMTQLQDEIKSTLNSIDRIELEEHLIVALQSFLDTNVGV